MARRIAQAFGTVAGTAVTGIEVYRRGLVGRHRAAQGAALQQARTGHLQIEIARGNALDQGAEAGIVEGLPPAQLKGLGLRLTGRGLALQCCPLLRRLAVGALKVRPEGAAGHEHGQQQGA
ncbi:hypothetical protein D3C79_667480 [compost metagenome]